MIAGEEAREYYQLADDATFREMVSHVRADEACHRDLNHHFADIPSYEDVDMHNVHVKSEDTDGDGNFNKQSLSFSKEE